MSDTTVSIFVDGPQIAGISANLRDEIISPRGLLVALTKGRIIQRAVWYQHLAAGDTRRAAWLYTNVRRERIFDLVTTEKDVDFELAVDLLEEAAFAKPDVIVLVTGDGDFVRVVRVAKRMGVRVEVAAGSRPPHSASVSLMIEAGENFVDLWNIMDDIAVPLKITEGS